MFGRNGLNCLSHKRNGLFSDRIQINREHKNCYCIRKCESSAIQIGTYFKFTNKYRLSLPLPRQSSLKYEQKRIMSWTVPLGKDTRQHEQDYHELSATTIHNICNYFELWALRFKEPADKLAACLTLLTDSHDLVTLYFLSNIYSKVQNHYKYLFSCLLATLIHFA